jgi:hypothetical protein
MTYVASHIATVPSEGYKWYLIFLLDDKMLGDPVKKEIDEHFVELGRRAGEDTLVVRGYDPNTFLESLYEYDAAWRERVQSPGLLVTDKPPAAAEKPQSVDEARVFLFSLQRIYDEEQTLATFLTELIETLNEPEAIEALEKIEKRQQRKKRWGWLTKYLMLEPNFQGFGVNLNQLIRDITHR